ncbi:RNA-directed DNA polymerase, eukaryota [Tanacetum coccineum]
MKFLKKRVGNGRDTRFWEDVWRGDMSFKSCFPRVYALKTDKKIFVADKLNHNVADSILCRLPRNGVEMDQYRALTDILEGVILPDMSDRWIWSLAGSGEFSVASYRKFIDDQSIVGANQQTRWIKVVPRKINILAWKIRFDFLPTRLNLSHRGVEIQSIICPTCNKEVESTSHVFFSCSLVRDIYRKIAVWWELSYSDFQKFDDWFDWLLAARVSSKQRLMLEGIFYIAWWLIWNNRNKYLFDSKTPSKEIILDVLCFTHKQRRDLSIWTTAAGMANDLFRDDSFVVILGEEVAASKVTIFDSTKDICDAIQARAQQAKEEIRSLLREGVSADKISSQSSPWASVLFEFLPPFIRKQEIHSLLREGVSADKISSQPSPWTSVLFEFLPPFIGKQLLLYPEPEIRNMPADWEALSLTGSDILASAKNGTGKTTALCTTLEKIDTDINKIQVEEQNEGDRVIDRLQKPVPLEYIPVEAEYHSAARDYGTLAASVSDIHWTHNFQEPPSIWRCHVVGSDCVTLYSCGNVSPRFQKGENQEGEDETDNDVDDTNGRRLSWHSDMDNGL